MGARVKSRHIVTPKVVECAAPVALFSRFTRSKAAEGRRTPKPILFKLSKFFSRRPLELYPA